ncbi:GGDEF domain-containing protein [Thiobacter aerophilum]|uniref:diguanylate cyclase n=1 Tax=Thiobacter aerophilum TaxID=3121275 RepID=A0ABV0ED35_9BURK
MATELLRQNLAIEPDLQNFIGFVLTAVSRLGGNAFAATPVSIALAEQLRKAGAGTGYPLPVSLSLDQGELKVQWNGVESMSIVRLTQMPSQTALSELRQHFQRSTEIEDPALLLRRNAEMARFLEESRARAERELTRMQAALEKRQAELADTLRQAETDPLTGLYNRRAYDARIAQAFMQAMSSGQALTLALCDLDHFKRINDEHGHQYGDAYLCRMAEAMRSVIRSDTDAAFRFGGDEFALLYRCGKAIALRRVLTLLKAMDGRISVGLASISAEESCAGSLTDFIARADRALYEAKNRGRGRVVAETCWPDGRLTYSEHTLEEANA